MLKTHNNKRKRRRCMKNRVDYGTGTKINLSSGEAGICEAECFGFERGPGFTLDTFQQYADTFKVQYFRKNESIADPGGNMTTFQEQWEPSVENIEGEYWRMVEKPTEEIEVLYGADLETGVFGSGFPKISNQGGSLSEKYTKSGWNLNNFPRLSGSVLSYESSDISGHVENHHLYSLNYMHWGAPKLWYGVPGKDALKLEAAMQKHLPDLFEEQPDLLHKLVALLSPSVVKSDGVPVYRCVQNSGEFILTFPRAYHSGFNCGFNCAEAVNVAPVDWLPHGQDAIELYLEQGRKTTISHDKLLFGAAREAVKAHWELDLLGKNTSDNLRWKEVCGKDGILTKALKSRVEMERLRRECFCNHSQAVKMESSFDATTERDCSVCLFDLHLSATGCHCSPERYAWLNHAEQLCSCSWSAKFFLFRYDINELDFLVKALEGKQSAVYRWGKQDLRLALSPYVSKDNPQFPGLIANLSCSSQPSATSLKGDRRERNSSYEFKVANCSSQKIKKEAFHLGHNLRTSVCQLSQEDDTDNLARVKLEVKKKKSSFSGNDNVILLSDDEGEKSNMPLSEREKQTSEKHTKHFERLSGFVNTMSASNCVKGSNLASPITEVKVMGEGDRNLYFHQKGPRIAKVVRRINCNVEPLEYGIVHSGKLWCDSRAIFPKGFKSRVRYISVLDPTKACYYASEILDAAWDGPLFMVSVEHCPSEVFIHVSAAKCWEMVRERVNQEIMKQHKLGRMRLPPLQPCGSLDGFEMFGVFSPAILQVIQAMDQNRVCTEYWKSHPQMQIPQHFQYQENGQKLFLRTNVANVQEASNSQGVDAILSGLFEKANPDELHALHNIVSDNMSTADQNLMTRFLNREIQKGWR
ncbi:unnamed protein product [Camellia sinensis]